MKRFLQIVVLGMFLLPNIVWAKPEDYQSLGLKETCEAEGINFDHDDYHESKEKANIYMFRGSGCEHCYEFLTYLEAITEEYGNKFNLISYEVWADMTNKNLMAKVARKLRDKTTGVPYIVIGEKSWAGYSESLNEEIFNAIEEEYENKNQNDIVTQIINEKETFQVTDLLVPLGAILIVGLFFFARSKTKEQPMEPEENVKELSTEK